jgi:NAD(P)-dependent dehydrogenase (short-subunit alcohol dehydrogenase family)
MAAPAVLVTGASAGIGAATVEALRRKGFRVYAGVHTTPVDSGETVSLDVTDEASVQAAATEIAKHEPQGLRAIVNNAGVIVNGPVELVPAAEWARQLAINVTGPAIVTAAFLPLLRTGRGRVINISAPSAKVAIPFAAPMSASKAALDSLTDALRLELAPFGIPVISVVPGSIETEIFTKAAIAAMTSLAAAPPETLGLYQEQLMALAGAMGKQTKQPPSTVADVIVKAIEAPRPRTRYVANRDARVFDALAPLPTPVRNKVLTKALGL